MKKNMKMKSERNARLEILRMIEKKGQAWTNSPSRPDLNGLKATLCFRINRKKLDKKRNQKNKTTLISNISPRCK